MGNKSFVFRFADVEVREREFTLIKAGKVLAVEPKAFRALLFLLHNPQRLISKEELLNSLWGDASVTEGSLTRCIWLLRHVLEDDIHEPRYIETVATVGYRFVCPVEVSEDGGSVSESADVSAETASALVDVTSAPVVRNRVLPWLSAAALLALSFGVLAVVHFRETPPVRQRVKFQVNPPEGKEVGDLQLSPDGRFLLLATGAGSASRIWIRSLDGLDTRLLADIQGAWHFTMFWSRDGEYVAFFWGDKLYKISRNGGPPSVITAVPERISTGVWLDRGIILLGAASGLFRISSLGGPPVKVNDQPTKSLAWLPAGHFLYASTNGIFAGSVDGGKQAAKILADASQVNYVPPPKAGPPGHLIFVRDGILLAQQFNADKLELEGEEIPVERQVGEFTASANGELVFGRQDPLDFKLTWFDRAGKKLQSVSKSFRLARNAAIRLSPNDSRAIVPVVGPDQTDLWVADLTSNTFSRFTFNGARSAIWSPDGRKVLWAANDGNRYVKPADGSGKDELLFKDPTCTTCYVIDWSADGKLITFAERGKEAVLDLWLVPADGERKAYPYLQSHFATYWAQFSPDHRWMAYASDQTPHPEQVFVDSIPPGKGHWQISTEEGDWPIWRRDGKELFYSQGTKLMAVPIRLTESSVKIGTPQALFETPGESRFQVSRDGQRFLIATPVEGSSLLTVDTDWRAGLVK